MKGKEVRGDRLGDKERGGQSDCETLFSAGADRGGFGRSDRRSC